LGNPNREDLELNEAHWWSNWAHLAWLGSAGYLLTSGDFREPFFNRACILDCRRVDATVAWAKERLMASNTESTITVFDSCTKAVRGLRASGYRPVDTMTVMYSNDQGKATSSVPVTINERPAADSWTRAYLEAFYGDQDLAPRTTPIVTRLLKLQAVTLLEARTEGEAAGVLAMFRTRGLAGVYCVGTVPEHRRQGVAGTLLSRAKAMAAAEGRRLVLQALASDVSIRFYLERGFKVLYSKRLLSKEGSNAKKNKHV
jgi:GNAT superfamily N-acetyltransferase